MGWGGQKFVSTDFGAGTAGLQATLETLESIIQASPLSMVVVDRDGIVRMWNDRSETMFGWTSEEVLGKPLPIIPQGKEEEFRAILANQFEGKRSVGLELRRLRKNGSAIDVSFWNAPLWNRSGEITGSMAIYAEAASRNDVEAELRRAQDELHRSEQRFRRLVESVSDYAIYMLDANGTVESWNPGAERIHGYQASEIMGKNFACLYPEEGAKPPQDLKAVADKGHVEVESWSLRKDGSRFWANSTISSLRDSNGRILGYANITKDLTNRKLATEERERLVAAMDAQRQLYQAVVEHAPAGIAIYDGESFRLKWANPTYRERLEEPYRSVEIVGRRLQEILPGAEKSGIADIFRKVAATGAAHFESEQELVGLTKGTTYWRWSLLPLSTAEQSAPDLMIVVVDVTDQVSARRQIEELAAQLSEERRSLSVINQELDLRNREVERANRLKSEFLASMSHELRTPLHSIIGFSELLAEQESGELNPKQSRQLDHILRGARHLLSLINDILDLSKIEAGRMELHQESFLAQPAIGEVLTTIEPMAMPKGIRIANEVDRDLMVWADRLRFKQILYNLLTNAVKFTPQNGKVAISSSGDEESTEITVSDTGVGIPLEEQRAIFNEFHQAATTTKGVREGTGLGLAITRRLVEKHGGEIWVDSQPDQGSRFTFSLPTAASAGVQPVAASTPAAPSGRIESAPILVVDDESSARELLVTYLNSEGFRTATARNGDEALRKARQLQPDAITLDLMLHGKSGWETLNQLKRDPATAAIPVVIVSVLDEKQTGLSLGAAEYLVKPVSKRSLLESLARHVHWPEGGAPRVLVVDDEPESRQLVAEILRSERYTPITAASGKEALELLSAAGADALVLDLLMPEMNGFELLKHIRSRPELARIPVFVLTAKDLTAAELELLDHQVDALFVKSGPWRQELLSRIRNAVGKRQRARRTRVLVADDSRESREFIQDALASQGFEITEAVDGKDALAKIQQIHPDLVFMDIQMPEVDGYAALRQIRQNPDFARLPVIALTAFAMQGDRDKALAAGFDAYISKPVDPRSLRAQVEGLLAPRKSELPL
jgi:PAS domain S-box-containing protein